MTTPVPKEFGNLSFDNYTVETDAEKQVLAIQAALQVRGYVATHPTMKKVLRLKRSMSRNKVRKYTFNLVPVRVEIPERVKQAPNEDFSELLIPLLEGITGLKYHAKEAKTASSGHLIVKFVLFGALSTSKVEPGPQAVLSPRKAQEALALEVVKKLGTTLTSFSSQPFKTKVHKTTMAMSVQCIYRGNNGKA